MSSCAITSFEAPLRRFIKELQKSGVLRDYRAMRYFVSKSEQRWAKMRKAEHRRLRKLAKLVKKGQSLL